MMGDRKLLMLVVLIIVVIIVGVLIFNGVYKTDEEREDNRHRLIIGIIIAILVLIALGWIYMKRKDGYGSMEEGEEYGVFSEAKRNVKNWDANRKAFNRAKKEGLSDAEAKEAVGENKARQRRIKDAGRKAEAAEAKAQRETAGN